ncbi:hypothetical protein [Pseudothermotoga sp.]
MRAIVFLLLPAVLIGSSIPFPSQERSIGLFMTDEGPLLVAQQEDSKEILLMFLNDSFEFSRIVRSVGVRPDRINDAALFGGKLILVGHSSIRPNQTSIYVCLIDLDGKVLKQKLLNFPGAETWAEGLLLDEEGIYLAGGYNTLKKGWFDAFLLKLNWDFEVVWSRTTGGLSDDWFHRVRPVGSRLLCVGSTESKSKGKADMLVVLYDKNGRKIFEKTFGGPDWDKALDALQFKDRIFVLGWTNSRTPYRSGLLLEMSLGGKIIKEHLIDLGSDFSPSGLLAIEDRIIVYGVVWNRETRFDPVMLVINRDGSLHVKNVVPLPNDQTVRGVMLWDGQILIYGESDNPITGKDVYVLAFDIESILRRVQLLTNLYLS